MVSGSAHEQPLQGSASTYPSHSGLISTLRSRKVRSTTQSETQSDLYHLFGLHLRHGLVGCARHRYWQQSQNREILPGVTADLEGDDSRRPDNQRDCLTLFRVEATLPQAQADMYDTPGKF